MLKVALPLTKFSVYVFPPIISETFPSGKIESMPFTATSTTRVSV